MHHVTQTMYAVTMRHDGGRVRLRVKAASERQAAERACAIERAPMRAVLGVRPVTA